MARTRTSDQPLRHRHAKRLVYACLLDAHGGAGRRIGPAGSRLGRAGPRRRPRARAPCSACLASPRRLPLCCLPGPGRRAVAGAELLPASLHGVRVADSRRTGRCRPVTRDRRRTASRRRCRAGRSRRAVCWRSAPGGEARCLRVSTRHPPDVDQLAFDLKRRADRGAAGSAARRSCSSPPLPTPPQSLRRAISRRTLMHSSPPPAPLRRPRSC